MDLRQAKRRLTGKKGVEVTTHPTRDYRVALAEGKERAVARKKQISKHARNALVKHSRATITSRVHYEPSEFFEENRMSYYIHSPKKKREKEKRGEKREEWMRKQRFAIISIRPVYPMVKWVISICSRDSGSIRNIRTPIRERVQLNSLTLMAIRSV